MSKGILSLARAFLVTVVPSLTTAQAPLGVVCIAKKGLAGDAGPTRPSGAPGGVVSFTNRGFVPIPAGSLTSCSRNLLDRRTALYSVV